LDPEALFAESGAGVLADEVVSNSIEEVDGGGTEGDNGVAELSVVGEVGNVSDKDESEALGAVEDMSEE
jgi:hypothetical protein